MKVFFLVFLVTLYINKIFNLDIDENITDNSTTSKYDVFLQDNFIDTENYIQEDIAASATAIVEVINEFFVKQNLTFDIVIFGELKDKIYRLVDEIEKRNIGSYTSTLREHEFIKDKLDITQSALFLTEGEYLDDLDHSLQFENKFPKKIRFLVYADSHDKDFHESYDNLLSFNDSERLNYSLNINSYNEMVQFQYFLFDDKDKVELSTFEWFTETECNSLTYKVINRFDKTSLKWEKQLEYHEKFKNFHNCLIIVVPFYNSYTTMFDDQPESFEFNLMDVVGTKLNFTQGRVNDSHITSIKYYNQTEFVELEADITTHAYFLTEYDRFHFTTTFAEEYVRFIITPGEVYTSYEKILMPFDELTWYFIIATFGSAFGVIFVVNFLPQRIQDYFYGDGVHIPAYNVVGTFFGIGQIKLPIANFSRMILIIFILFCLIIRTAYQGVMFDMMTKEMRKSSPQTIDELFERNFNVSAIEHNDHNSISDIFLRSTAKFRRVTIHLFDYYDFKTEICSIIFDPMRKFAVNVDDDMYKMVKQNCKRSPKLLSEVFMTIPFGIGTDKNHFLLEGLEEVMQHIIPAGIPQYWYKYHQWYQFERNHYGDIVETGATVLRLEDLSFGFIIWMVACGVAVLGLLGELLTFAISKMKKLAKVEPTVIKVQHEKLTKVKQPKEIKNNVKHNKTAKVKPIKPKKPKIIQVRQQQKPPPDVQVLLEIQEKIQNKTTVAEIEDKTPESLIQTEIPEIHKVQQVEMVNEIKKSKDSTVSEMLNNQSNSVATKTACVRISKPESKAEIHEELSVCENEQVISAEKFSTAHCSNNYQDKSMENFRDRHLQQNSIKSMTKQGNDQNLETESKEIKSAKKIQEPENAQESKNDKESKNDQESKSDQVKPQQSKRLSQKQTQLDTNILLDIHKVSSEVEPGRITIEDEKAEEKAEAEQPENLNQTTAGNSSKSNK